MTFKYQEYIHAISNCPPSDYQPIEMTAYRFVFEENHEQSKNSFLPVLMINPKRQFKKDRPNTNEECCQGYALSLFNTQENAKKHYDKLRPRFKNKKKTLTDKLGTHLAEGSIEKTDGVASKVNVNGHFSLHEFKDSDITFKFKIITQL